MLDLLKFNNSKPSPGLQTILLYSAIILIVSQLIFIAAAAIAGVSDVNSDLAEEKKQEYEKWQKKGVTPWGIASSEFFNSTIYSPIAEELMFRVVLMKYLCIDGLKLTVTQANIVQATLFGAMHLTNSAFSTQTAKYTYLQTLSATITGAVSGWVYVHTNSIFPSLISHIINNAAAGTSEVLGYVDYLKTHKTHK